MAEVARGRRDHRGDTDRARRLSGSLGIHQDLVDAWGVSHSLSNLSFLALEAGDAETARTLLSEALAIERESGRPLRLANALGDLRRGSPPGTGSRRSLLGCTPARRYSASAYTA